MKKIQLTRGKAAMVSDEDFEELNRHKWSSLTTRDDGKFYAARTVSIDGKPQCILMHRVILGLQRGDKRVCDHINRDTLDNRRENLRVATNAENIRNQGKPKTNTSGFKGVHWDKRTGKWQTTIRANGKSKFLGRYDTPEAAHAAYRLAAIEHHGEFARME